MAEAERLGPTGEFPRGAIHENDQGEIKIAIGVKDGAVVMAFGKRISWIGFGPAEARALAKSLLENAHRVDGM